MFGTIFLMLELVVQKLYANITTIYFISKDFFKNMIIILYLFTV